MRLSDTAPSHTRARRGFNLIEAAIVLGVVGVVIGGIWVAASAAYEKQRQSKAVSDIGQTVENIRSLFRGVGISITPISPTSLVFPADIATATTNARSPWDGTTYTAYYYGFSHIGIVLESLPVSVCASLAPRLGAAFRGSAYLGYNGKFVYTDGDSEYDLSTPEAAAASCGGSDSSSGRIRVVLLVSL